jgi:hypothetical protein
MSLMCLCSCHLDFKKPSLISLSIQEAKDRKVFIAEYKIVNIKSFSAYHSFPIDSVWKERTWHLDLNKSGDEVGIIDTPGYYNMVFSLNNKDSLFTIKNALNKWIISGYDNTLLNGLESNMLFIPLYSFDIKDTATLSIYKMNEPNDFKNNVTKLFEFTLQRD